MSYIHTSYIRHGFFLEHGQLPVV